MSNNIWEHALLLGAGGIIGLIAGALLTTDDEEEDASEASEPDVGDIEAIFTSLQGEAQRAVANCETEEERTDVRERIQQAIQQLQDALTERSEQEADSDHAADTSVPLGGKTMPKPEESLTGQHVQNVEDLLSRLGEVLRATMADGNGFIAGQSPSLSRERL